MTRVYEAVSNSHGLAFSKSGTPCVRIGYQCKTDVTDKMHPVPLSQCLLGDLWITESAIKMTKRTLLDVFGWDGKKWSDLDGTDALSGVTVELTVEDQEWEGKTREVVKFVNLPGSGHRGVEPIGELDALNIDSKFGHLLEMEC